MVPPSRQVSVRFSHRGEQLTELAKELGAAWANTVTSTPGALPSAVHAVEQLCAERVHIKSSHPLGCADFKGLNVLRQRLADVHKHQSRQETSDAASARPPIGKTPETAGAPGSTPGVPAPQQARVLLAAADEQADTAFCLLQLPSSKVSSAVPHAGDAGPAHILLKMDIILDDVSRCVASVSERAQLPASLACFPDDGLSAHHLSRQQQRAPPFPAHLLTKWASLQGGERAKARVHSHGDKRVGPGSELHDRVQRVLSAWVRARNTGVDTLAMLDEAGCGPDFALLDAFGMVPLLCGPVPEEAGMPARDAQHSGKSAQLEPEGDVGAASAKAATMGAAAAAAADAPCLAVGKEVLQLFDATKAVYDVDCKVLDCAVCMEEAAAFTHWRATQRNRVTGAQCNIEAMEVDLLDPATGALRAAYLFRDLMDFEHATLEA